MIRAGLLALVLALASPAAAEGLVGQARCGAVWVKLSGHLAGAVTMSGNLVAMEDGWCVIDSPVLDMLGQYVPDWHAERFRFRGTALSWLLDRNTAPDRLELSVEGLRLVVQTGQPQMDWLFAAQARPNRIAAELALAWDAPDRAFRVEMLRIDFPGENLVEFSARAAGVDLSSPGAMQMSATSFAVTEADLHIQTHGLFEWYVLMSLGPLVLPQDGDMEAAVAEIRAGLNTAVADLPETSVSAESKAALGALIAELPNPSGDLTVALRSGAGIGPTRLGGYAIGGVPESVAEAAPLFDGVTIDVGWTHADAQ